MIDFNYEKAYCVQALPAFNNLPYEVLNVHSKLIPLVGELSQGRDLNIPMTSAIEELINSLTTKQIAELSRASYFVGHWQPSFLEKAFENKRGESWKIADCCDQILRKRLVPPHNVEIHKGSLRVTFSNKNCWTWREFGLATEENLQILKECNLPFGETTLEISAKQLADKIGDLWGNVDELKGNDLYSSLLKLKKDKALEKVNNKITGLIPEAQERAEKLIEEAKIKTEAFTWLINNGYIDLDNVIYYTHTKRFCFGWRTALTPEQKSYLQELLTEFLFDYDLIGEAK